ncbi:hypothetical protein ACIHDR_35460 [Nocardia sp. NPDC052278]
MTLMIQFLAPIAVIAWNWAVRGISLIGLGWAAVSIRTPVADAAHSGVT